MELKVKYKSEAPCCHCQKPGSVLAVGQDKSGNPFTGAVCWEHLRALLPDKPTEKKGVKNGQAAKTG